MGKKEEDTESRIANLTEECRNYQNNKEGPTAMWAGNLLTMEKRIRGFRSDVSQEKME